MTTVFFTSDTHFGHANIIKYCSRPYSSVEEMNEALIANWNARVGVSDVVFHLGDVVFRYEVKDLLARLNGKKHLIIGNHDKAPTRKAKGWASVSNLGICGPYECRHHPLPPAAGCILLHGHQHNKTPRTRYGIDVGVDAWSYAPVSYDELRSL